MKKILFTATLDSHIKAFHLPYLKWFQDQGFETHVACNCTSQIPHCDVTHNIPFERSPFHFNNIKAYIQLKQLLRDNDFSLIHAHTPVGGALTRFAARETRAQGTKVFYTAHGFHFFKGSPIKNWLIFYPIEKFLSYYTDCLITINKEDYELTIHKHFKATKIVKIDGVGVSLNRFKPVSAEEKVALRKEKGYSNKDFILFFAAEINDNKNQLSLIPMIKKLVKTIPNLKLLLAGDGVLFEQMQSKVKEEHLTSHIHLLGHQTDIYKWDALADIIISSSKREGLPINLIEGMACGKPIVASDTRGNRDLVIEGENGFLYSLNTTPIFNDRILQLYVNNDLRSKMSISARNLAQLYSLESLISCYTEIYCDSLE